jgi:hypothetical protein
MGNSRLISLSCRRIAKDTQAKLAIAYADTDAGEIGTVYQASNWVYIGKGSSTFQWISPNGRIMDQKLASNLAKRSGGLRSNWVKALKDAGWREQESNPKHRYVYVLDKSDKALVKLIEQKRCEYPKRNTQHFAGEAKEIAHHVSSVGTEGASPIHPLLVYEEELWEAVNKNKV